MCLFYNLPQELINIIYSYDPYHRELVNKINTELEIRNIYIHMKKISKNYDEFARNMHETNYPNLSRYISLSNSLNKKLIHKYLQTLYKCNQCSNNTKCSYKCNTILKILDKTLNYSN